ncbi:274_t:CDS:2 [Funneliformis geosporum]|uniref:5371_t:CDS:1 n=1 Tax=Funneliformis geosporum TaxID=1117311 RepID=A0A9W4STT7_9GLOM|nr:274_t:CDS:2 [Funneliformis geosporum]CAI2182842.1 5371_t:CDS:2 [Funneliformis geosporum]
MATEENIRESHIEAVSLTDAELVEIRQRTFEGAYWRTCLSSFGFALVILRIFEKAFYSIGLVFIAFGGVMLCISALRRRYNLDIFDNSKPFVTSGGYVVLTGSVAFITYLALLIMILRMDNYL